MAPAYGLPAVDHQAAAIAIDAAGQVLGVGLGADAGRQLLALMEWERSTRRPATAICHMAGRAAKAGGGKQSST